MKHLVFTAMVVAMLSGCTHRIEVAAKEPITINMNLKIDHEIRVKVDKELDALFEKDDSLF
jgi:type IV pilus biogenesis protein CpaD/CtpE